MPARSNSAASFMATVAASAVSAMGPWASLRAILFPQARQEFHAALRQGILPLADAFAIGPLHEQSHGHATELYCLLDYLFVGHAGKALTFTAELLELIHAPWESRL